MISAEKLFDLLNVEEVEKNPFQTEEGISRTREFNNTYLEPFIPEEQECDTNWYLYHLLEEAQKTAFVVGFNAAISLILGKE